MYLNLKMAKIKTGIELPTKGEKNNSKNGYCMPRQQTRSAQYFRQQTHIINFAWLDRS